MGDDVNLPSNEDSKRRIVTDGFFEREIHLSRDDTAKFFRDLADQIEADTTLTISSNEWEIPFEYEAPIEVEVEFTSHRGKELEIELEFTEPAESTDLDVS